MTIKEVVATVRRDHAAVVARTDATVTDIRVQVHAACDLMPPMDALAPLREECVHQFDRTLCRQLAAIAAYRLAALDNSIDTEDTAGYKRAVRFLADLRAGRLPHQAQEIAEGEEAGE